VVQAWAGSFDGILHKDIAGVNTRLAADCRTHGNGMLLPFGSVNPKLPDWREDVRRCHEQHRMPGVRLHPNYHGYDLTDPVFFELLEAAAGRRLIVQVVWCMEDERTQHPLLRVPNVDLSPLPDLLRRLPDLRVQILNWKSARGDPARRMASSGQVYLDFAMTENPGGIARLLKTVPLDRVLFGSNFPLFYFESALLKIREAGLSPKENEAVSHQNARRLR
jgi:predicted TIM-barrel fold metal-dependent hydrolase